MSPPLITLKDIALRIDTQPLFRNLDLVVRDGDRMCLVGRNGSGKSTLLKVITGTVEPDQGDRFIHPGCRVVYLPQEPDFADAGSVAEFVASGLTEVDADARHRVEAILAEVGLVPDLSTATLSGGEARRASLVRALVGDADVLLLDEPTNHLDLPTIEWLEERIAQFRGAVLVISHDRRFLERVTRTTLWLDRGVLRRMDKGFAHFESWQQEVEAAEDAERRKLDRKIAAEARWAVEGITARRKRNQGRLRALAAMRQKKAEAIKRQGTAAIRMAEDERSGKLVIEARSITKRYGERVLFENFSTRIARGDRVGIIGPNGSGKSTLVKVLIGELAPDDGTVRLGSGLSVAYLDQGRTALRPEATVKDILSDGNDHVDVHGVRRHVASYAKDFLFAPSLLDAPVHSLSGGERNRLLLARTLARPANFLVLDEPTNDLDMDTLDVLEDILGDYKGTVLLVSHDRDFLDRIVTSTIALEGDGSAIEYAGGYSDYLTQRKTRNRTAKQQQPKAGTRTSHGLPGKPQGSRSTRLSYKHKHRLKTLPQEMEEAEKLVTALEHMLGDPTLYERDPARFDKASKALGEAQARLAALEEEWLELEILREEAGE
ncbi:MAG: ATP-binding cassette domain-containing protein [Alphaproteobacteria bacterium]|nr:MAG: ATP-binding cassette domain-containing protein [Alphaproteobacteria bacterium]